MFRGLRRTSYHEKRSHRRVLFENLGTILRLFHCTAEKYCVLVQREGAAGLHNLLRSQEEKVRVLARITYQQCLTTVAVWEFVFNAIPRSVRDRE
jgi:hypothetical protein